PGGSTAGLLPAACVLGFAVPVVMLLMARAGGGSLSFPVDDAWIHLQYARNLVEHGAFSYFPGDRTTAGSTAPLFTLLEALALLVSRNELVAGVGLGLAAYAAFIIAVAKWGLGRLGHPGWAAFAVAMVALDGRFGLLAISGMETSLFMLGVALAFLAWSRRDALGTGVALGAAAWVRPEALVLAGVFAIDALLARRAPRRLPAGLIGFAALIAGYLGFNLLTGGTAFPNTLAAKAAFYAGKPLTAFLREDVGATFAGGWLLLAPLALGLAAIEARRLFRGRDGAGRQPAVAQRELSAHSDGDPSTRAEFGWAVALVLAYALVLPFSHRFNRYLVPALPAVAIAGTMALRAVAGRLGAGAGRPRATVGRAAAGRAPKPRAVGWAAPVVAVGVLAVQGLYFAPTLEEYGKFSRYHLDRHVRAGRWLAEHTPPEAVVATHDVGAIAFYSRRRIVDMAGLITPEVVPHLNKPGFTTYLEHLFAERGVTHLAVLENWQPVDNQAPLFEADSEPEILHVYDWRPGGTHLVDFDVSIETDAAGEALRGGDLAGAARRIAHAMAADSGSARLWILAGALADREARYGEAAVAYGRAVRLYPHSPEARTGFGASLARLGQVAEARAQLDSLRSLGARPELRALLERLIEAAGGQ
ncbi:MAG: tetratricopeptide repeat protein, partial [Candidatus Eisenbacteria bacterium]